MNEGNRAKTASAPAVAVLAVDTQFYEHTPTLLPFRPELKDVFAANEAMRTTSGMFNATLQAGYFILSIRAHGLAAGPMSGFDAASIDAEFVPPGLVAAKRAAGCAGCACATVPMTPDGGDPVRDVVEPMPAHLTPAGYRCSGCLNSCWVMRLRWGSPSSEGEVFEVQVFAGGAAAA